MYRWKPVVKLKYITAGFFVIIMPIFAGKQNKEDEVRDKSINNGGEEHNRLPIY